MSWVEILQACVGGLLQMLSWPECGLLVLGVILGAVVGILPGLGGSASLAILLPLTVPLPPSQAFALLIGVAAVVATTGDLTSILIGIPGEATSAATVVDGHRMTLKGEAARAIGASLASSLAGSVFGAAVLALSIPAALWLAREIGSPELFMLALAGVTLVAPLSRGSGLTGVIAGGLGALLGTIGLSPMTGTARFTFGQVSLWDGIGVIPLTLGLFAVPEMVQLATARLPRAAATVVAGRFADGLADARRLWPVILQSSALATIVGIIPGVGASVAQWLAYGMAARRRPSGSPFGDGAVEGVIAPSAANNATLGASLIPALALGVPGGVLSALLLSAMLMKGLVPGPSLLAPESQGGHLTLVFGLIWLLVIANLVAVGLASVSLRALVSVTRVRGMRLMPLLLTLTLVGAFAERRMPIDMIIAVALGALGLAMSRFGWPRAPMLLGLVLVPLAENRLFISIDAYGAAWLWRPGVIAIALITMTALVATRRQWRDGSADHRAARLVRGERAFTLVLLAVLVAAAATAGRYGPQAALLPRALAAIIIGGIAMRLWTSRGRGCDPAQDADASASRLILVWLLVFIVAIWALGFVFGATLATLAFVRIAGGERWTVGLTASAAIFALLYGLLGYALGVPFPRGALVAALS
jgi:putative tricarboxylic transport membrane protein